MPVEAHARLLEDLDHAVFGNAKDGLTTRVTRIESDLYADPKTGKKSLEERVENIERLVLQLRGGWWLVTAALLLLQLLDKLGVFR
ncbi:MAG TPA: hypothetical protein VF202_02200 [Trueperaceae bacterium]|jgi:hypothetical protein